MSTCDEIRLLIGPFDDGELEPHEMEEIAFHVVGCVGCKAALDDYRELGVALRGVAVEPSLDGFAAKVAERIDHSWIPLHVRLGRMRELFRRVEAVFEIAIVAAATAMLTLVVASPYVRNFSLRAGIPATPPPPVVANTEPKATQVAPVEPVTPVYLPGSDSNLPNGMLEDPMTQSEQLLSELGGGESPSVAVWDEPHTGTTVVYVPDQR